MLKIERSSNFDRTFEKITLHDKSFRLMVESEIKLFRKNPNDTRLKNHALRRKMKGKYAFKITDDIRIVYQKIGKNTVRFLAIGGHIEVYGNKSKIKK